MSMKTMMTVEEYLRTTFDGADCEYLDGEVVERNMGELPHGDTQLRLIELLLEVKSKLGLRIVPEIRIPIHARRYRVADIAVWRAGDIGTRIPTVPPLLVIEILSPEDRLARMLPKIQEYLSIGVKWIWLVDPQEKKAIIFSQQQPAGVAEDFLRTDDTAIAIPLERVFSS